MIYTSYFGNLRHIVDKEVVPISICSKPPNGYHGLEYKRLVPSWSILKEWKENHDKELYVKRYLDEVLAKYSVHQVVKKNFTK